MASAAGSACDLNQLSGDSDRCVVAWTLPLLPSVRPVSNIGSAGHTCQSDGFEAFTLTSGQWRGLPHPVAAFKRVLIDFGPFGILSKMKESWFRS